MASPSESISALSDTPCRLGEGPFYCQQRNTLYWFSIAEKRRFAHNFSTGMETFQNMPEMASAMAIHDEAHDVVFTESGLWLHERAAGCWSPVCMIEDDNDATRSNDARVHPSGAFWLSTMGKQAQAGAGAIYHYRAGALTRLFADITIPNAICFSPDGKTAYFTDTPTAKMLRVAVDPDTGLPVDEPETHIDHKGKTGGLDGAICDGDGALWVALWGAGKVHRYDGEGVLIGQYEVPARQVTCPAFVGHNRIAITSAWDGLNEAARKVDAKAGFTFLLDPGIPIDPRFEPRVML